MVWLLQEGMGEGLEVPSASCFLKPFSQPVDSVNMFTLGLKYQF